MKAGVLIIGSLLWDNDQGDNKDHRKKWRLERLLAEEKIHVFAPIRYGRESDGVYTMVFSKETVANNEWGTAYVLPCKKTIETFRDLKLEAEQLSNAEGAKDSKLVKGGKSEKWCIIGIIFNPSFEQTLKEQFLNEYVELLNDHGISEEFKKFCIGQETSILKVNGEIDIEWPKAIDPDQQKSLNSFDFIIATCPQQNLTAYPAAEAIANGVLKHTRKYFFNNIANGITTFQDRAISDIVQQLEVQNKK